MRSYVLKCKKYVSNVTLDKTVWEKHKTFEQDLLELSFFMVKNKILPYRLSAKLIEFFLENIS